MADPKFYSFKSTKAAGLLAGMAFLLATAIAGVDEPKPLTASRFAALIERLSEEDGYFWNDNYVSNEASYLHPLGKLRDLGIRGGIYLGVGPNQNFTYIAKIRPRYAFIVDIRKQNLLEHLLFKALFHYAKDRREYLSLLLSRPLSRHDSLAADCSINEMVAYFGRRQPDPGLYRKTQARVRNFLTEATRLKLTEQDFRGIDKIHSAFFLRGLSIKYDYLPVPTYREFLLETDLEGSQENFLNSNDDFAYLKRMQAENRIVPVVGNFAGLHALREIGKYLVEQNEKVKVFYTSNVEQYLIRSQIWPHFLANVRELPVDDDAVFIRAYWSPYIPHPDAEEGYMFTQVLQAIKPFLARFPPESHPAYWEIVTSDIIKLR